MSSDRSSERLRFGGGVGGGWEAATTALREAIRSRRGIWVGEITEEGVEFGGVGGASRSRRRGDDVVVAVVVVVVVVVLVGVFFLPFRFLRLWLLGGELLDELPAPPAVITELMTWGPLEWGMEGRKDFCLDGGLDCVELG